jgi:YidC/Oxa1 family membrane protein insertase
MIDNKNTIIAIILSAVVLIGWQYFIGGPEQKAREEQAQLQQQKQQTHQTQQTQPAKQAAPAAKPGEASQPPATEPGAPTVPGQATAPAAATSLTRAEALKQSARVPISTGSIRGSIALKGGRIDDLFLTQYRETIDPKSPPILLLSPSGAPMPFYAEFGWTGAAGSHLKLPNSSTVWKQEGSGALSVGHPVTLTYDNGQGLQFRRTISVDNQYMFKIDDQVVNKSGNTVSLYPYGLISRHGTPTVAGTYMLHEGLIGYLGKDGLQEITYKKIKDKKNLSFDVTNGWLGITDKYWAATLVPDTAAHLKVHFSTGEDNGKETYQTDYLLDARTIAPGATASADTRLFAGAKEVSVVNGYQKRLNLNHFDLLIDWGWFYFITKPMFMVIDWFYHLVGNFGIAILIVTVLIKLVLFPLANKSYVSMSKMKKLAPEMQRIKERYADDRVRQQQAMMELYKKEKVNPASGCLPIVVQIPVFFALYKVLFVTIEMRHAPFFGWIRDLSAPDPTTVFNLFGLIPWEPPHFLMIGVWPLIMGLTMWVQMKLNPAPPDPVQQKLFAWMPVFFTFLLASFPAGLVIYWAWNNSLSVVQQSVIMKRQGVDIPLLENLGFKSDKKKAAKAEIAEEAPARPKGVKAEKRKKGNSKAKKDIEETPREAEGGEAQAESKS